MTRHCEFLILLLQTRSYFGQLQPIPVINLLTIECCCSGHRNYIGYYCPRPIRRRSLYTADWRRPLDVQCNGYALTCSCPIDTTWQLNHSRVDKRFRNERLISQWRKRCPWLWYKHSCYCTGKFDTASNVLAVRSIHFRTWYILTKWSVQASLKLYAALNSIITMTLFQTGP